VRHDHDRLTVAARRLLDEKAALAVPRGIAMRAVVKDGLAPEVIAATALDEGADIVVVGSHGHDGDTGTLIGRVGERVVRLAPCSVVVVKPPLIPVTRGAT
jgi:nucleotide-binding universal stress UspA family protein